MFDISAQYSVVRNFDVVFGLKNVGDQHFELAWGFPQPLCVIQPGSGGLP